MALTEMQAGLLPATNSNSAVLRVRSLAALAAALLLPLATPAADWEFDPRIDTGISWTDNVALAADDEEESEWIAEVSPGVTVTVDGPRISGTADYRLQILRFNDNSDLDDAFNQFEGTGNLIVLPETTFIDGYARYDQLNVDTDGRQAFSNFFTTDNRTDYAVLGVSPYDQRSWGSWGESLVRFNGYAVRYYNVDPGAPLPAESDNVDVSAYLGSPDDAPGISWRGSGSYSFTDFDDAENFKYAQVRLDGGMPVGNRTRLTGTVGQESDVIDDQSGGGLDETLWFVGFEWDPSDRQSFELRGGDRFYGTAWEGSWRRRGSRGELSVDYGEEPTTSTGVVGDDSLFLPGFPTFDIGTLDSRVFLQKRLSGVASYELSRSVLEARVYSDRREFLDAEGGNEDSVGASVSYDWDAAVRTRVGATINLEKRELQSGRKDGYAELNVRVTREINRIFSAELRLSHFLRDSSVNAEDYTANLVSVIVQAQFGGESAAEL